MPTRQDGVENPENRERSIVNSLVRNDYGSVSVVIAVIHVFRTAFSFHLDKKMTAFLILNCFGAVKVIIFFMISNKVNYKPFNTTRAAFYGRR